MMDAQNQSRRGSAELPEITERLRAYKRWVGAEHGLIPVTSTDTHPLMAEAADEIDRLRAAIAAERRKALEEAAASVDEIDDGEAPEYRACQEHIRALIDKKD